MVLSRNYKKFKEVLLGWSTECKVGRDEASGPGREDHEGLVHSVQLFKLYPRSHGPSWRGFLQKSDTMRIWFILFIVKFDFESIFKRCFSFWKVHTWYKRAYNEAQFAWLSCPHLPALHKCGF